MRLAILIIKLMILLILENRLRRYGVPVAKRGRRVENSSRGVGDDVGFAVLVVLFKL